MGNLVIIHDPLDESGDGGTIRRRACQINVPEAGADPLAQAAVT
jgi:hypothetical protein